MKRRAMRGGGIVVKAIDFSKEPRPFGLVSNQHGENRNNNGQLS